MRGASVYRADEVARWPQGVLERLVGLGILREIRPAKTVECDGCMAGCIVTPDIDVNPQTGRVEGYYYCRDEEYGGPMTFAAAAFRRWELHFAGLCAAVAAALRAKGAVIPDVTDRISLLGVVRFGDVPREVFLARGLTWADATSVVERAGRLKTSAGAVVLVPDQTPAREAWHAPHHPVVRLVDIARLSESLIELDRKLLCDRVALATEPTATRSPTVESHALTQTEFHVLEALHTSPHETMVLVELEAAAGYGRRAVRAALARLTERGFVGRPPGTQRKGTAITAEGIAFLEAAKATSTR